MKKIIQNTIKLYKKANRISSPTRGDYPAMLDHMFGLKISSEKLEQISGRELMDKLIKEGGL